MSAPDASGDPNPAPTLASFPPGGVAAVFGASGGIGAALADAIDGSRRFGAVLRFSRGGEPRFDLGDEDSIERAAERLAEAGDIRLVVLATGVLEPSGRPPERSWRELDASAMAQAFAVNAIGPALVIKHVLPRFPRTGRSVFAALSARVGSIGDNRLGGWWSYRASKAALNQIVRTAAVELARRAPEALCVALHPGTVATPLSAPFVRPGTDVLTPERSATRLLDVIDGLGPADSGGFCDWRGAPVAW